MIHTSESMEQSIFEKMHQSTIYRRNEKRMQKSYQLRDDPRIAPVRILSGLPGFRNFVKPFDQIRREEEIKKIAARNENLSKSHDRADLLGFSDNGSNIFENNECRNQELKGARTNHLPAIFFSGCVGGSMEAIFGRSSADELSRVSRQVSVLSGNINVGYSNSLNMSSRSMMQINVDKMYMSSIISEIPRAEAVQEAMGKINNGFISERIVANAFASGLLFTANAYFRSLLCREHSNEAQSHSVIKSVDAGVHPFSPSFLAASAATGFVTATVFSPFELVRSRLLMQQSSSRLSPSPFMKGSRLMTSLSTKRIILEMSSVAHKHGFAALFKGGAEVYSKEMVGNMVYFSTYEMMKSTLARASNEEFPQEVSTSQIFLSGATAGVAYWTIIYPLDTLKTLLQSQPISNPRFQTALSAVNELGFMSLYRGYLSCVMRAAPANAILLLGYETALSAIEN